MFDNQKYNINNTQGIMFLLKKTINKDQYIQVCKNIQNIKKTTLT